MINLLNHNTSYKHSKLSARPPLTMYCGRKQLADVLYSCSHLRPLLSIVGAMGLYKNPIAKGFFEYQSRPLLCWRYDSHFFNLQGFFFSILKALHTCWYFVKNNKKIVFVSTDNPSDTGHSGIIDHLTQTFAREFLPRIQTETKTSVKSVNARKAQNQKLIAQNSDAPAASRRTLKTNRKRKKYKSEHAFTNLPKQINMLSALKNMINIATEPQLERTTEPQLERTTEPQLERTVQGQTNDFETSLSTNSVYHKLDGLLFRAASRRLSCSFSRLLAPFFSNAKASFQDKFSHLLLLSLAHFDETASYTYNRTPQGETSSFTATEITKGFESKKLWPFNLNNVCSIGYFSENLMVSSYTKKKANRKIRNFGRIRQQRAQMFGAAQQLKKDRGFKKKPFVSASGTPATFVVGTRTHSSKKSEGQRPPFAVGSHRPDSRLRVDAKTFSFAAKAKRQKASFALCSAKEVRGRSTQEVRGRNFGPSKSKGYVNNPTCVNNSGRKGQKAIENNKKSSTPKKEFTYEFLQPVDISVNTNRVRRRSAFNSEYRELQYRPWAQKPMVDGSRPGFKTKNLWSSLFWQSGQSRNGKTDNKGGNRRFRNRIAQNKHAKNKYARNKYAKNKHAKRKAYSQMTRYRLPYMGWRNLPNNTRTFVSDFYGTHTRLKACERMKTFAYNPYLLNADLVFFVNPDKNPGLASQIQKLGIPSIGIVSGLKSTAYRKQPHYSNLHNSVTYPILGNPDNLLFVTMVVRIFVRLIDIVQNNKRQQTHKT